MSIYEIARHVVIGDAYPVKNGGSYRDSKAYAVLLGQTTNSIIQQVREHVAGSATPLEITSETAYKYLAAAKVVDSDTPASAMKNTTYKIRELCLFRSDINMMNAFSTPPLDMEEPDAFLVNEVCNGHPLVKATTNADERNALSKRLYGYSQKKAVVLPELIPVIEKVIGDRYNSMMEVAKHIPEKTLTVFKGCSGAGKSHALNEFVVETVANIPADRVVQSTDNTKNDIRERTGKIFSDQHAHLIGFSIFRMMLEVIKERHPLLSSIQEGWFNSPDAVNNLFKDLNKEELKLEMRDYDGDFSALALRVLARQNNPLSPRPPFDQVIRGFKTSRESRPLLLKSLREGDTYSFTFVDNTGHVGKKDPLSISTAVDAEIEETKSMLITEKHAEIFGHSLKEYVGMTIQDAFKGVKK